MEDVMVLCRKCGNKSPSSSMKLDVDEKAFICPECIKNKSVRKEINKTVFHKKEDDVKEAEPRKAKEDPDKIRHKCSSCGFKFRVNIDTKTPKNCPYCNSRVYFNFL